MAQVAIMMLGFESAQTLPKIHLPLHLPFV
jgi:hypothetical protein